MTCQNDRSVRISFESGCYNKNNLDIECMIKNILLQYMKEICRRARQMFEVKLNN